MKEGIVFILSGPAGSGKTTLIKRVVEIIDNLMFSVSCTTRRPRPGEKDGVDYRFISEVEFERMVRGNLFVEWALVHGKRYGTPVEELKKAKTLGVDLLLDIDTQGAKSVRKGFRDGVFIFVTPPSLAVLKDRLGKRKSESRDEIVERLVDARVEMEEMEFYDYIVINDSLGDALENLISIIRAERCKRQRVLEGSNQPRMSTDLHEQE